METTSYTFQSIFFTRFLVLYGLVIILLTCLVSHVQPVCDSAERAALLQFKDSFVVNCSASGFPSAYPRVESWSTKHDCCSWDGVECDDNSTHVIALRLKSSCLYGSINSTSSVFHLSHLRILDLSDNDFNDSQIPSTLANLSGLSELDLSFSVFDDQIPSEISLLSNLSYLDLSFNTLEMKNPEFSTLVRRLTNLKYLRLRGIDISSKVPAFLANFSALTVLSMPRCGLYGEFPSVIFQLPNLRSLNLGENRNLTGSLPEFHLNSSLRVLALAQTNFSGPLPSSIGNLKSLTVLDVERCSFSGPPPVSLGTLENLQQLNLFANRFSGEIPSWLGNLSRLALLRADGNWFRGSIPQSFARLTNLESLIFNANFLSGRVDFSMFYNMKSLYDLQLSGNKLWVVFEAPNTTTLPNLRYLYLATCNLTSFPDFRNLHGLKLVDLNSNAIHGPVPSWIWNMKLEKLVMINNLLTGFDGRVDLPMVSLRLLDVSRNNLTGPLPVPPPSIVQFDISYNKFSGDMSQLFCNLTSLLILDLSHNNLSGSIPKCLRNLSSGPLKVLRMSHNLFSYQVPQMCQNESPLMVMDLSNNQLQGSLPRSLANCRMLQVLNLNNNQLSGVFPSWLSTLPNLKLLQLRSNLLHGAIEENSASSYTNHEFPSLRIIDISHNNFSGWLPSQYIQKWNAMKYFDARNSSYLSIPFSFIVDNLDLRHYYTYSMTITNKGKDMEYKRVQEVFTVIDLSSNTFQGDIPEWIGKLQGLQALNLSNNMLAGKIPSSLAKMTQLESLDLSNNNLSGEIPQQLVELTFLAFFNVSYNRLQGPIPRGTQFDTFDRSSYKENPGLWGYPLTALNTHGAPSHSQAAHEGDDQDSGSFFEYAWITIVPGFIGGLGVGVVIELTFGNSCLFAMVPKVWS